MHETKSAFKHSHHKENMHICLTVYPDFITVI